MKQLTKKQKVFVLKEMIRYYENETDFILYGMCYLVSGMIIEMGYPDLGYEGLKKQFPEFTKPRKSTEGYWYSRVDKGSRIEYCKRKLKLIESK